MRIPGDTAIGLDLWETRWLRRMSDDAAEGMADLLNSVEENIAWPIQILINIIVLMGKPHGDVRPIALMPMLYRLWTKIRNASIDEWGSLHHGPWDAAIRGSSALRAACIGAFFDEVHTLTGHQIASVLWDME